MKKYTLASEILKVQFNQVKNSIDQTLAFLQEHSEMEIFAELQEVANDIFDCFTAEYDEIRANDTYQMLSDAVDKTTSPLMAFWQETIEMYGLQVVA